jgi:hypothetical protein
MAPTTRTKPAVPVEKLPDLRKAVERGGRSERSWAELRGARERLGLPAATRKR